jgi:hypothetical protein
MGMASRGGDLKTLGSFQGLKSDNENGSCCGIFELYIIRFLHDFQYIEVFLFQVSRVLKI